MDGSGTSLKNHTLVFGDGLLGNAFKHFEHTVVLSHAQCDITDKDEIESAISYYKPTLVVNAAGSVPRRDASINTVFKVNAFAPHYIADVCYKKARFVQVSTDCVFFGNKGRYTERDEPDATDIYGMSKHFGEPTDALVIRTSFVGLPDPKGYGLFAWASQQSEITGYDKVFWNGASVFEVANKILELSQIEANGVRHVYSYTLSKYDLLIKAKEYLGWKVKIYKESDLVNIPHRQDRTLDSIYDTGFIPKSIDQQLKEMAYVRE